ncbi:MAG: pentapeptide repeat-containing protein [Chloroflexota bacterium]
MRHSNLHPHGTTHDCDFTGVDFRYSQFQAFYGTLCADTDFRCCAFVMSSFENANLTNARFAGTYLAGTRLTGANLSGVTWQEESDGVQHTATLPDGTLWTPATDMRRFTDKTHPQYHTTLEKVETLRDTIDWEFPYDLVICDTFKPEQ